MLPFHRTILLYISHVSPSGSAICCEFQHTTLLRVYFYIVDHYYICTGRCMKRGNKAFCRLRKSNPFRPSLSQPQQRFISMHICVPDLEVAVTMQKFVYSRWLYIGLLNRVQSSCSADNKRLIACVQEVVVCSGRDACNCVYRYALIYE